MSRLSIVARLLIKLTLTVYPGSVLLKAPGIEIVGVGVVLPPPVTLTCAQLM